MKKVLVFFLVAFIFTGCRSSVEVSQGERFIKNLTSLGAEDQSTTAAPEEDANDPEGMGNSSEQVDPSMFVACYPDSIHPIGLSIADQFSEITNYQEVMDWFCDGAEFEDILNALLTEELSNGESQDFLEMIATGYTWDDIWLELGITEQ